PATAAARAACIQVSRPLSLLPERQRHRSRRAVIDYLLHYAPNQAARIALLEALPAAFSDAQLAACLLTAQCASKLEHDRFLEHGSRDCLGGARIPSVLARLLAHIVPKPAVALGRVGRDHRPLAAMAEQQSGQQCVLPSPSRVRPLALPGAKLIVHFLTER